jgi:hypothetical protein
MKKVNRTYLKEIYSKILKKKKGGVKGQYFWPNDSKFAFSETRFKVNGTYL